ncbi:MAG: Spy/CpxP family protein refolding chaperone [Halioglobus sp.]|nr:Spy/CpxP family protein refolding chaperone [Halioglobus sp.]
MQNLETANSRKLQRSSTRILLGSVAAGALTLVFALSSWSMSADKPERMLNYLSERLSLSSEQHQSAEVLFNENSAQLSADLERMHALRKELMAQRSNFDAGEAKRLADELGELTTRRAYQMASSQAALYEMLTAEQKAEMDALVDARQKRHASGRYHHRWRAAE